MKIYIGADHRGFELKNKLIGWLKSQSYAVEDCGNRVFDPEDDYPDFAQKVVSRMIDNLCQKPHDSRSKMDADSLGLLVCGSGVGVSIAANRYDGIRCVLGFNVDQVRHARAHDHVNVLALPSDYADEKQAREMVAAFIRTETLNQKKYLRRIKKLDSGSSGVSIQGVKLGCFRSPPSGKTRQKE